MQQTTPTRDQKRMLEIWQQHTYAEFALRDANAALATMTWTPYVMLVPAGTGGEGRQKVAEFYEKQFLPNIPPDLQLQPVSQLFADDRIIEESVVRFTHSLQMDWMLPGLEPTGRAVEFLLVGIVRFEKERIAAEHLYWDQAMVLHQLGSPTYPGAKAALGVPRRLARLAATGPVIAHP